MIRINLLLNKKSKGTAVNLRLGLPSYVIFVIIAVVAVLLIEGYTWYWLNSTKSSLANEKKTLEVQLSELKEKVKEVESYEKDKELYGQKITIIQNLKKSQKGPVRVLDEVSMMLPERVWIISLKEKDGKINVTGSGMTNDDIVKYVNNLKSSRIFQNVQLTESRQVIDSGIPVYNFNLIFNINLESV
ncbi:MAG: PilN domain-containing protein [Nitrospirae bacterium]|nr:PilN domain-containing protein [Nitrospirota bacterium]